MRLSDCFIELIAYTALVIRPDAGGHTRFEQVDADIRRLIAESEASCQQGGFSSADYDLARFAVFAWIDETILSSAWEGKNRWLGEQLQRRFYHTADAGKLFFERLNTIGPHQLDVREIYYLCLAMGFTGQYCNEGDDYLLEQLKLFKWGMTACIRTDDQSGIGNQLDETIAQTHGQFLPTAISSALRSSGAASQYRARLLPF